MPRLFSELPKCQLFYLVLGAGGESLNSDGCWQLQQPRRSLMPATTCSAFLACTEAITRWILKLPSPLMRALEYTTN
eukprot:572185-Amphidinium_carterae.1